MARPKQAAKAADIFQRLTKFVNETLPVFFHLEPFPHFRFQGPVFQMEFRQGRLEFPGSFPDPPSKEEHHERRESKHAQDGQGDGGMDGFALDDEDVSVPEALQGVLFLETEGWSGGVVAGGGSNPAAFVARCGLCRDAAGKDRGSWTSRARTTQRLFKQVTPPSAMN